MQIEPLMDHVNYFLPGPRPSLTVPDPGPWALHRPSLRERSEFGIRRANYRDYVGTVSRLDFFLDKCYIYTL